MKRIHLRLFLIIVYLSFSISHVKAESTQTLTPITLQLRWKHQFQFAGFYAAIEQGYYQDVGLNVEVREYQKNTNLVDEVVKGNAHYGISDSSLIINKSHGDPVVLLANIFQHSPMVLLSRADAKVFSPAQMVGKSIMLSTHKQDNVSVIAMLITESVKLSQMTVKKHSFKLDNFIKGNVDIISAYATNEPAILKERNFKFNMIEPINYGIDFYGNNIFTSEKQLQEKPQQVKDFVAASLKGWQYAMAHSEEVIELILAKYSTDKTRSALSFEAQMLKKRYILPEHIPLGSIDSIRMERIVDIYKQLSMIPSDFILEGFIYQPDKAEQNALQLTKEERLWIKQHPKITIGVDSRWVPFEFINEEGEYSGMSSDYINLISEKTGLKFEVQHNATWKEVMDSARNGTLDLLPALMASPKRKEFLNFAKPHIKYPLVIVTRDDSELINHLDELSNKKVTVVGGHATEEILRYNHPSIQLKLAKNLQEALKMVSVGEVDALVNNMASVSYNISQMGINNLRITGKTDYQFSLSVAVPKHHKTLLSIVEKALASISKTQRQKIRRNWISVKYQEKFNYKKMLYPSLATTIFILLILLWNRSLAKEIIARTSAEKALYENQKILEYRNHILELLSKGTYLSDILESLVRSLEKSNPNIVCSILLLDKQKKYLIEGVTLNLPEFYKQAINRVELGLDANACAITAFTGESVVVEDMEKHPWKPFRQLAQSTNLRACCSQAILSSKKEILGSFSLYNQQSKLLDKSTLHFINELSALSALAIESYQNNETLNKLSLAVAHSENVILITNCDGIIEYVNPKFTEITGYTREEAIGNTSRLLKPSTDDDVVFIGLWDTLLSGKKWQGEYFNRKKNGERYWAWNNITPIKNDCGKITHFVEVQLDFSARKQAEEALQESENRFRQLFEGAHDSIFIINPETKQVIDANKRAASQLGYSHSELLQLTVNDIHTKERSESIKASFKKLQQTGELTTESLHRHKNGSQIPVEISAQLIEHNNISVCQAIVRDISKRKQTEQKLIDSEAQFRSLVENTNIIAWTADIKNCCFTYVSPQAEIMLGYPPEDWMQAGFWENHIADEDRKKIVAYCSKEAKKSLSFDFEYRMIKHNGEKIWLRDIVSVHKDSEGNPTRLSGFLIDIDKRKKIEFALEKAKLEAELANKVKSEFLATITHELRTPMNGVLGMAQILEETSLNVEQKKSVDVILRSGNSLLKIINDVLDLSKLEAEQVILEARSFNLEQLINDTLELVRPKSNKKSLDLTVAYPANYPRYFVGDATRLQQILVNLTNNALKFTPSGSIRLTVLCKVTEEYAEIKLSVEDTGIGIAAEKIAHLFDPFIQADQSTTRKYGGSGLGLTISKKLINLMHGNIQVDSVLGQGSTFWVSLSLPLAKVEDAVQDPQQTKMSNEMILNGKILLVEDNNINQQIALCMLNKTVLSIDIAENGQQAIDLWQKGNYDFIFMDCRMPVMDGYQATKNIREQETGSRIPIVALTANSSPEDIQRCIDSGMDKVITKPFHKQSLIDCLKLYLNPVLQHQENTPSPVTHKKLETLAEESNIATRLDRALLEKLKQEMGQDFLMIVAAIKETIEDIFQQFDEGLKDMPNEKVGRLAHSLKSPAANLGALRLRDMAREFEVTADNANLTKADVTVQQLKQEYQHVLRELEKQSL